MLVDLLADLAADFSLSKGTFYIALLCEITNAVNKAVKIVLYVFRLTS